MPTAPTLSRREAELMDALRHLGGSGRNAELARVLDVSEETVRRTIKTLAKAGLIGRVHGGAHLTGAQAGASFFRRIGENPEEKLRIAEAAAAEIGDGMTVFLDVGSTTAFVAEALRQKVGLTVVTNSIGVAQVLSNHNGNRVHVLGGEMQGDERGTFGPVTEQQAGRFAFDVAVLSADALSAKHGVLYQNAPEARLVQVAAEGAERVIVVLAHPKFGKTAPHRGPAPEELDLLVTDLPPGKKLTKALADWGISTVIAEQADNEKED
ncbi:MULTISPECIES: DeoR/GlpR family DNA-binding transcription regulator [Rhodobacterales]|jgi:DeoR family glycerol-3-phosphate regulon repressor|uniref:DeoR/GlpR family DNA-binding transcription regulator n=1 Tax=Rhodobacterales TaxID=204455 RepID=UPI00237F2FCA|nr:DeoR family transcriptional regulator [Phaeobacter gallaeciensis]MDE4098471.1 DeoR family transcriptional regulator [Phaeobacter gallaeciensis]MDE4107281.1 DeoR family transcriptional regulator [Phaeobacter gallaeciensis]MDE4111767.1 DeoR family transcriptional regulator [Phaeobacter gallaeciensis]MDE4116206.1 DeoR family transcriptional regulator [Phaeobacter gallaeciensis]MDE4120677.1 DeoR family transcriptional regulator [Phaeobacter gallaeciensis]